jgi:hypothetical protein
VSLIFQVIVYQRREAPRKQKPKVWGARAERDKKRSRAVCAWGGGEQECTLAGVHWSIFILQVGTSLTAQGHQWSKSYDLDTSPSHPSVLTLSTARYGLKMSHNGFVPPTSSPNSYVEVLTPNTLEWELY